MIHYPGKDVKGSPVKESLKPSPKASIGIVLVDSQQATVYFMCFWP